jgi:hypothetical protein
MHFSLNSEKGGVLRERRETTYITATPASRYALSKNVKELAQTNSIIQRLLGRNIVRSKPGIAECVALQK